MSKNLRIHSHTPSTPATLALCGLLLSTPVSADTLGTLTVDGTEMPVLDAVAVWDADRPSLAFYLLPITADDETIGLCRRDDTLGIVEKHPTPDPERWPDQLPWGRVEVYWRDPDAVGDLDEASFEVFSWRVTQPEDTGTVVVQGGWMFGKPEEAVLELEGNLEPDQQMHLKARGGHTPGEHRIEWNLDLRRVIVTTLEE